MSAELYKIGNVAKLTGISVECLRAWERRYGMEPAERAGKTRFYSAAQIEWLKRIKSLIDHGHTISQLINLDDDALEARLRAGSRTASLPQPGSGTQAIGIVGSGLMMLEREYGGPRRIDVHGRWASKEGFEADASALPDIALAVVETPSLDMALIESFQAVFGGALVIVYRYATAADLDRASRVDVGLLSWPVTWDDLEQVCLERARPLRAIGTARRFSQEQLVHIATADVPTPDGGTQPRDIVRLIDEVDAFAVHASRCGETDHPDMHFAVAAEAHAARARLEDALQALVDHYELLARPTDQIQPN